MWLLTKMTIAIFRKAIESLPRDVFLKSLGGDEYSVHQCLLKASSPVFSAMMESQMKEATTCRIDLNSPSVVVEMFVDSLYGSLESVKKFHRKDPELIFLLLQFYDQYDVDSQDLCHEISSHLYSHNIMDYLDFWVKYPNNNHKLLQTMILKLRDHIEHNHSLSLIIGLFPSANLMSQRDFDDFTKQTITFLARSVLEKHDELAYVPLLLSSFSPDKRILEEFIRSLIQDLDPKPIRVCPIIPTLEERVKDFRSTGKEKVKQELIHDSIESWISKHPEFDNEETRSYIEERISKSSKSPYTIRQYKNFGDFMGRGVLDPSRLSSLYLPIKGLDHLWELDLDKKMLELLLGSFLQASQISSSHDNSFSRSSFVLD